MISRALDLEADIRAEENKLQGLRQLVRLLRKAGELYLKDEMSSGGYMTSPAKKYLNRAMELALGEADTPDQVAKIRRILDSI